MVLEKYLGSPLSIVVERPENVKVPPGQRLEAEVVLFARDKCMGERGGRSRSPEQHDQVRTQELFSSTTSPIEEESLVRLSHNEDTCSTKLSTSL